MKIETIKVHKIRLPFKGDFSISKLRRLFSETVVVEIIAEKGEIRGYGEGLPVEFVTGETTGTVVTAVKKFSELITFPWDLSDVEEIWNFVDSLPPGKENNAAICALEMSLLDALARFEGKSVLKYFGPEFFTNRIRYSASITLSDTDRIRELCEAAESVGINHIRIKMDRDLRQNREALEIVKEVFANGVELRIDPNAVWDRELAFQHIPLIQRHNVGIVEEPMPRHAEGFLDFAGEMKHMGVMLMACESAPTLEDVKKIVHEGYYQIVNVKISRSGGFRRSLKIIDYIRSNGLHFQIGCTIGESGILSSAGRALGLLSKDAKYYDGSYDSFILKENITTKDVTFGMRGEAGPLEGPGLGVLVDPVKLNKLKYGAVMTINKN